MRDPPRQDNAFRLPPAHAADSTVLAGADASRGPPALLLRRAARDDPAAAARQQQRRRLLEAFTPTRPQLDPGPAPRATALRRRFIGREAELARILAALRDDRAHVLLYGERGFGKTSLANLALAEARRAGFPVARHACSAGSDLDSILRGLFADLPLRLLDRAGPHPGPGGAAALLPAAPLRPDDVNAFGAILGASHPILVIDEFDRIADETTRTALADTIKQVADRGVPLSFMLVGVSDSPEQLLGRHASLQRCVAAVPLPLLTRPQVAEIVAGGAEEAGVEFPPAAQGCIAALARGLPYAAHLLALRAGQSAIDRGRAAVDGAALAAAMEATVAQMDPRLVALYEHVTRGGRDAATAALLRAAATTHDAFGRFRVAPADAAGGVRLGQVRAERATWRRLLDSGAFRAAAGGGPDRFVFGDPMLPVLVLVRAVAAPR